MSPSCERSNKAANPCSSSATWLPDRKSTRLNSSHTVIYTLSLHDALPILNDSQVMYWEPAKYVAKLRTLKQGSEPLLFKCNMAARSEEHTSELQSHRDLHSFPTRRSSDLERQPGDVLGAGQVCRQAANAQTRQRTPALQVQHGC